MPVNQGTETEILNVRSQPRGQQREVLSPLRRATKHSQAFAVANSLDYERAKPMVVSGRIAQTKHAVQTERRISMFVSSMTHSFITSRIYMHVVCNYFMPVIRFRSTGG